MEKIKKIFLKSDKKQIGCGYCLKEATCKIRDPKINKAKLGCKDYKHYGEGK